jgi:hypothetical protein
VLGGPDIAQAFFRGTFLLKGSNYYHSNEFTVSFGCGTTVRENTTYFQSQFSQGSGQCGMTVCKCQENVCQVMFIKKLQATKVLNQEGYKGRQL